MKDNRRVKILAMIVSLFLAGGVVHAYALGNALLLNESLKNKKQGIPSNSQTQNTSVTSPQNTKSVVKSPSGKGNQQTQVNSQAAPNQSGRKIYQQTCQVCHGAKGKGTIPGAPNFTSATGPLKNSDTVLLERIINGYQSPGSAMAMPPRRGNPKLTDDDLKQVLSYIRSKFGGK